MNSTLPTEDKLKKIYATFSTESLMEAYAQHDVDCECAACREYIRRQEENKDGKD